MMDDAYENFLNGVTLPLVHLLDSFFARQATRSLRTTNEANLQTTIELLLAEPECRIPGLRLVVDHMKDGDDGRYGFVDIFLIHERYFQFSKQRPALPVIKLKDLTLQGLWRAWRGNWSAAPQYSDLEKLRGTLRSETETQILARKYMFWDQKQKAVVTTTVAEMKEAAMKQLQRYIRTMNDVGVCDPRVLCIDTLGPDSDLEGDDLIGHMIMAIGGVRAFIWSIPSEY
jgi:hypothetical protein